MAPPKGKKKTSVKLEELMFYFDGVERDRLDSQGVSRKSGEVLALRDRLLKMPDTEFDATIKTVKGLLTDSKSQDAEQQDGKKRQSQAAQLFAESRTTGTASTSRTSKVSPA